MLVQKVVGSIGVLLALVFGLYVSKARYYVEVAREDMGQAIHASIPAEIHIRAAQKGVDESQAKVAGAYLKSLNSPASKNAQVRLDHLAAEEAKLKKQHEEAVAVVSGLEEGQLSAEELEQLAAEMKSLNDALARVSAEKAAVEAEQKRIAEAQAALEARCREVARELDKQENALHLKSVEVAVSDAERLLSEAEATAESVLSQQDRSVGQLLDQLRRPGPADTSKKSSMTLTKLRAELGMN